MQNTDRWLHHLRRFAAPHVNEGFMNGATTRDPASGPLLVRHEGHTPRERSGCGWLPPGVVHGARGRMRVLVIGVPDIADDDYFAAHGVLGVWDSLEEPI